MALHCNTLHTSIHSSVNLYMYESLSKWSTQLCVFVLGYVSGLCCVVCFRGMIRGYVSVYTLHNSNTQFLLLWSLGKRRNIHNHLYKQTSHIHYTTFHFIAFHSIKLCYITLHSATWHYMVSGPVIVKQKLSDTWSSNPWSNHMNKAADHQD